MFLTVMGSVSNTKAMDTTTRVRVVAEAFFRPGVHLLGRSGRGQRLSGRFEGLGESEESAPPLLRTRKENGSREKRNMSIFHPEVVHEAFVALEPHGAEPGLFRRHQAEPVQQVRIEKGDDEEGPCNGGQGLPAPCRRR